MQTLQYSVGGVTESFDECENYVNWCYDLHREANKPMEDFGAKCWAALIKTPNMFCKNVIYPSISSSRDFVEALLAAHEHQILGVNSRPCCTFTAPHVYLSSQMGSQINN